MQQKANRLESPEKVNFRGPEGRSAERVLKRKRKPQPSERVSEPMIDPFTSLSSRWSVSVRVSQPGSSLTSTVYTRTMGRRPSGTRIISNRVMDTKILSAVRELASFSITNVRNDNMDTCFANSLGG